MATRFLSISTSDIARRHVFLVIVAALLAACGAAGKPHASIYAFESTDTLIPSRGISIPVTFVSPVATGDEAFPLVVMAHGHGGTRHESGGYKDVAARLAEIGIASIRMDFPGCGDSRESFIENNVSNMLADILASRDFAINQPGIDRNRVGLFGFSMGGRLVLLLGDRNKEFKAIATWAPAASNGSGSMISFLGGETEYTRFRQRAAEGGFVSFTTQWGQEQQLGLKWFEDLENSNPLDVTSRFEGSLLVLYGDQDTVVLPAVSEAVIAMAVNTRDVVRHVIAGAGHGLGIYSGEAGKAENAISETVRFLSDRL
ncbi:MAG TPA: alpha/beta fold hydrolase [Woeseiaceae bacterium]|nr:alpha/beta fold hydrolase [Woeseiaceae bacterium]